MRRLAVLLAVVGLAGTAASCGDDPPSSGAAHVESRAVHARATDDEAEAGAPIVQHVAAELWAPVADAAGSGNLAYSPLSIATALGMTRAGVEGRSATELDHFFGTTPDEGLHRALNAADEQVRALAGPVQLPGDKTMAEIDITTANALWGQSGMALQQPFLDELRTSYDASMWTADFEHDPERARAEINDWVKGRTAEKIPQLIPTGAIDHLTRLVLTNAIHLKAPWPTPLDEVGEAAFTTAAGERVQVPMLQAEGRLPYREGDGWQAVSLPYAGGRLALTLVVPDEGKLRAVEAQVADGLLADPVGDDAETSVALRFPAWDIDVRTDVKAAMESLGVKALFTQGQDFRPMTTEVSPLAVTDVLHQATVTVDKDGTEAAAATAVIIGTTSAMVPDVELTVDRPFLFVIHDTDRGTPLFVGRITDPTAR